MTKMIEYAHWREVPARVWRWKYFSPEEMACKGTGALKLSADALDKLEALRAKLGKPMIVTSGYRSPQHNADLRRRGIGAAKNSPHMRGIAFDISMANHDPAAFIRAAKEVGFNGIGTYPRSNFVHVDTGDARTWGAPFPVRAVTPNYAPEARRVPETVREDPDVKAAIGILGSGGVAAAVELVAPASGLLGQLAPVAQTIAVIGIAVLCAFILFRHLKGR